MKILKLARQPAVNEQGHAIVTRKVFLRAVEGQTDEVFGYTTEEVLFGSEPIEDINIRILRLIIAENQLADVDALVAHLQNPPRLYPVF